MSTGRLTMRCRSECQRSSSQQEPWWAISLPTAKPPNQFATDGHLWPPIVVMKQILDSIGVPNNQRLYPLSFYEHRKCATARGLPCVDANPPVWAQQTVQG